MAEIQIENAVQISYSPAADQELKRQAMIYLQQAKESRDGWQTCLLLFTRTPKASEITRLFALDALNATIQQRYHDYGNSETQASIQKVLIDYMKQAYFQGDLAPDPPSIQNKLSQTVTYLFVALYTTSWPNFFDDIISLTSLSNGPNGQPRRDNLQGVVFFLRMMASVHDEVADLMVPRSSEEAQRNVGIKDCVRDRDVTKIVAVWMEILTQWNGNNEEIVEMCLKVIGRWVSWIDISLVVTSDLLNLLFQFLASEGRVRDSAIENLTEIVGKKMRGGDKLQLILVLNLEKVVGELVASPTLRRQGQPDYDTEFAERVAKLVNSVGVDLVRILDTENIEQEVRERTEVLLQIFLPYLLRFFSDEYDEVLTAVMPFITDLLSLLRKEKKANLTLSEAHSLMLPPILSAIVMKTKYDDETIWGDEDEQTEEAEFEELRKRLKALQDSVAALDEGLYIRSLSQLVDNTFDRVSHGGNSAVDWREVDLALYEMYQFGELALKNGGIFVQGKPSCVAAEGLVQMMVKMMNCNIANYSHPAVKLKYMEILVRYAPFFEVHTNFIQQALTDFVNGVHDKHIRVKTRSWYLFRSFVKTLRQHIGNIAQNVLEEIGDLLIINAESPKKRNLDDDMSSDDNQGTDSVFDSQLYLFEAVGCLSSAHTVPQEKQTFFARSVMNPLFADMEKNLPAAKAGGALAALQMHHNIMALGTLARGFSDWSPGTTTGSNPPSPLISEEFKSAAEAILVSLESLSMFSIVRLAARHSFTRLVGVLGPKILPMLPRWIDGLLASNSTKEDMSVFLRLLDQLVHGFKNDIYDILNSLLTPLLNRIFSSLGESVLGTDDEIQLAELRREYLNFLLVILNNDLGHVLVSDANQGIFEQSIGIIEHFAKNNFDPPTQKLAFALMAKMSTVWGPATKTPSNEQQQQQANGVNNPKEQPLSGFEKLMIEKFSLLCWEVPSVPEFNPRDAQAKLVLGEIAGLQKILYVKLGNDFLQYLGSVYFPSINFPQNFAEEYFQALRRLDIRSFKSFFQKFMQGLK